MLSWAPASAAGLSYTAPPSLLNRNHRPRFRPSGSIPTARSTPRPRATITARRAISSVSMTFMLSTAFYVSSFPTIKYQKSFVPLRLGSRGMDEPYSITPCDDRWVVSVREQKILACAQLVDALRAVKEATNILNYGSLSGCDHSTKVVSYYHSILNTLQLVAHKNGFRIELHGERFYIRPRTGSQSVSTIPTHRLPYFRTLGEIRRFLIEE
jgi:hypothetical protein